MKRIVVLSFLYCSLAFGEQEIVTVMPAQSVQDDESQKEMIDASNEGDLFEDEHTALDNMHEVGQIEEHKPSILSYVRVAWRLLIGE